jgi:hypothetical protein
MALADTPVRACEPCNRMLQHVSSPVSSPGHKAGGRRNSSIGLLGSPLSETEEGRGSFVEGGKGWSNDFNLDGVPEGAEGADGSVVSPGDDRTSAADASVVGGDGEGVEPSDADETFENPARRHILFEGEPPADTELLEQRFHALALDAKLKNREWLFHLALTILCGGVVTAPFLSTNTVHQSLTLWPLPSLRVLLHHPFFPSC